MIEIIAFNKKKIKLFDMDKEFRPNKDDIIICGHYSYLVDEISYDADEDYIQIVVIEQKRK